jgi:hypothetical protein
MGRGCGSERSDGQGFPSRPRTVRHRLHGALGNKPTLCGMNVGRIVRPPRQFPARVRALLSWRSLPSVILRSKRPRTSSRHESRLTTALATPSKNVTLRPCATRSATARSASARLLTYAPASRRPAFCWAGTRAQGAQQPEEASAYSIRFVPCRSLAIARRGFLPRSGRRPYPGKS